MTKEKRDGDEIKQRDALVVVGEKPGAQGFLLVEVVFPGNKACFGGFESWLLSLGWDWFVGSAVI